MLAHWTNRSTQHYKLLLTLATLFCLLNLAFAGNLFISPDTYPVGKYPSGITTADVNNDGSTDLITANRFDASVSVLLGLGNGKFRKAIAYKTGTNPWAVAVADFNQDGISDLVTANSGAASVSVLFGRGNGSFTKAINTAVPRAPRSIGVGDFNGDGLMDVVTRDFGTSQVSILLGHGDGKFSTRTEIDLTGSPNAIAVADFNSDGKLDLAVATNNFVDVLLGRGDGSFQSPVWYGSSAQSVTVGDFTEDGHLDLVFGSKDSPTVGLLLGSASGAFRIGPTFAVATWDTSYVAATKLDQDTHLDLVVVDAVESVVYCLSGNGNATFQKPVSYAVDYQPQSILVGDFNGDGRSDLATTNGGWYRDSRVDVLLGNGNGRVRGERTYRTLGNTDMAVADFNNDGKLDLLATGGDYNGNVSTLFNLGDGSFRQVVSRVPGLMVAAGDFNGDGIVDIAITTNKVNIYLGNGDGTFQFLVSYPSGQFDSKIIAVDFDRDGILDLAIGMYYETSVGILLGKGDGTFRPEVDYAATGPVESVTSGDFNRDGILDLAAGTAAFDDSVSVLLGNGDGTFQPAVGYPAGSGPYWVSSGDLNRDGVPDLIVANFQAGFPSYISVLIARGDGTFMPPVHYGQVVDPETVAVGDFNGDGFLDVATTASAVLNLDWQLAVFLGNGDGTLQPEENYPLVYANRLVVSGNFNGDGKDDLAAGAAMCTTVLLSK
jgi:hypothetical protein